MSNTKPNDINKLPDELNSSPDFLSHDKNWQID